MQSFCIILQKHIKSKEIIFSNDIKNYPLFSSKNYHEDFLDLSMKVHHMIYYITRKNNMFPTLHEQIEHKFKVFNLHVLENDLITSEVKERLFAIFSKSQKTYYAFSRLATIYKYKKYKKVVDYDLTLNPLIEEDIHTFTLIHNKCKYLFSLKDLINIIETALLSNCRFFMEPTIPKNPYNNVKFDNTSLYNIYFKMKLTLLTSQLFDMYYISNFSLETFKLDNEPILRDMAIKRFTYNSPPCVLQSLIIEMLNSNYYTKKLKIHKDFPIDMLAEIFRPFLYKYLLSYYTFIGLQKGNEAQFEVDNKLERFYKHNPDFGRKYIQYTNIFGKEENKHYFNSNHINFYNKIIRNNIIDNNCIYMLDVDIINEEIQTIRNINNQNQNIQNRLRFRANSSLRSRSPNNNRNNNENGFTSNVVGSVISIGSPHTRETTPNASPNNSPQASYSVESSISFLEIYNQTHNQLTDNSSDEDSTE